MPNGKIQAQIGWGPKSQDLRVHIGTFAAKKEAELIANKAIPNVQEAIDAGLDTEAIAEKAREKVREAGYDLRPKPGPKKGTKYGERKPKR
jgi:hypothetical protein